MATIVWAQEWTESERGWGRRPDGFTIHAERKDIERFVREMREQERKVHLAAGLPDDYVPDSYSFPDGEPYPALVSDEQYAELKKSTCGLWWSEQKPPQRMP